MASSGDPPDSTVSAHISADSDPVGVLSGDHYHSESSTLGNSSNSSFLGVFHFNSVPLASTGDPPDSTVSAQVSGSANISGDSDPIGVLSGDHYHSESYILGNSVPLSPNPKNLDHPTIGRSVQPMGKGLSGALNYCRCKGFLEDFLGPPVEGSSSGAVLPINGGASSGGASSGALSTDSGSSESSSDDDGGEFEILDFPHPKLPIPSEPIYTGLYDGIEFHPGEIGPRRNYFPKRILEKGKKADFKKEMEKKADFEKEIGKKTAVTEEDDCASTSRKCIEQSIEATEEDEEVKEEDEEVKEEDEEVKDDNADGFAKGGKHMQVGDEGWKES